MPTTKENLPFPGIKPFPRCRAGAFYFQERRISSSALENLSFRCTRSWFLLYRVLTSSVSFASFRHEESSFTPLLVLFGQNPFHWASVRLCPVGKESFFFQRITNVDIDQVHITSIPLLFCFIELFALTELFADAEDAGEDAVWRDLKISGEEGVPVEMVQGTDLTAEDVVDGCDHEVEVLGPGDKSGAMFCRSFVYVSRVYKIGEGLESCRRILGLVYIKHPNEGLGFVAVGEVRIVEHDEDLEDDTVVCADGIAPAVDFNCDW